MTSIFIVLFFLIETGICFAVDVAPLPPLEYDAAKAELGKKLFFDPKLSGNGALSCASCHDPETGFTTQKPLSDAYTGSLHFRNAPTLINTAYKGEKGGFGIPWHWDGRIGTTLNDMVRDQLTESQVMNMDMRIMQERIKQFPAYVQEFGNVFDAKEPSNGLVRKAIPEFLKTLTSKNVPFDRYIKGDKKALSPEAEAGFELFKGKAGCIRCHNGPMVSDGKPHNTGVPENPEVFKDPLRHATYIAVMSFLGLENYMNRRRDVGFMVVSHDERDLGKFITPTLRELEYTGPYMHNGMFATLEEVVEFYNTGGGADRPGLKDLKIVPLNLTEAEKTQLIAFLLSMSGDPLIVKPVVPDMNFRPLPNWIESEN